MEAPPFVAAMEDPLYSTTMEEGSPSHVRGQVRSRAIEGLPHSSRPYIASTDRMIFDTKWG